MANNRFDIGDVVASQMQEIIHSDEHKRTFFNKKANDKCCSCSSCGDDCSCKTCEKSCKGCEDTAKADTAQADTHTHDSNCAHDKTSAVDEMIELLSKISSVQDDLGLVSSSIMTMKALAVMVKELHKNAQEELEDNSDVRFQDLVPGIRKDPELHRDFRLGEFEDPEIMELLRQRINESDPDFAVSADPTSDLPDAVIDPDAIIDPEEFGNMHTWAPDSEKSNTEMPPESMIMGRFPKSPLLPEVGRTLGDRDFSDSVLEEKDMQTIPIPRNAFDRLNDLLKKQAQDGSDFEDEEELTPEEEAELMAMMENPDSDFDQALLGFKTDEGLADDTMFASDLDEEMESGNFLELPDSDELPENRDPGFSYTGEDENYPNIVDRWPNGSEELPQRYRSPSDTIRVNKEWTAFNKLSPEERLELEMGAGLHERLDIDPDELNPEEVSTHYGDTFEDEYGDTMDPEEEMIHQIRNNVSNKLDKYEPGEIPEQLEEDAYFWHEEE